MLRRLALNLFAGWFRLPRWFPTATMRQVRDVIAEGERGHAGELCLAIEARQSPWSVLSGVTTRDRAERVFSLLRVWDTEDNSGVLLYLQLAERRVELLADRGIAARVDHVAWQEICADFAAEMQAGDAAKAVLACLAKINGLLVEHFPAADDNARELPDDPVVL